MKKAILAFGVAVVITSCGNSSTADENNSDSTTVENSNLNAAPMGDTANQINNRAGNFPMDSSNKNGDDSISGTSPASRSTTPGAGKQSSGHGNE
ncbi:MAG TPA: hypothetical protein VM010_02625 [Chitinophagaceae bacterium]|nr:hypothetical protein [Chitinophagaceae bacterium]